MERYSNPKEFTYYSKRYNKYVTVPQGFWSDGATFATDLKGSKSYWVHDILLIKKEFDDGTSCNFMQASYILHDILKEEGRWFRCYSWFLATLVYQSLKHL